MSGTALAMAAATHGAVAAGDPLAFHAHVGGWLAVAVVAGAYGAGVRRVVRISGRTARPSRRQLLYLAGALVALAGAVTYPLADLAAHWSLTALVVQRLLLTLAVAPLLLLAAPAPLLAMLTRPAPVDALVDAVTRPVVAVVAFTVVAIGTLVTPAVAAQASSGWWRGGADAVLVLAGMVLWAPAVRHLPGAHRTSPVGLAAYLFVQSVVPTFPAVVYVFARHPLYPAFTHVHQALGLSRLVDQQLAGVVAKVATLPVLWSAAWAALARAQRIDAAGADEPLTWAEVERQLERVDRAERRRAGVHHGRRHGDAEEADTAAAADPPGPGPAAGGPPSGPDEGAPRSPADGTGPVGDPGPVGP